MVDDDVDEIEIYNLLQHTKLCSTDDCITILSKKYKSNTHVVTQRKENVYLFFFLI